MDKHRCATEWTQVECEAAVVAYFEGLRKKLAGQPFNRAQACRSVAEIINRPQGAVDYKFQSIDAVLYKHEMPRMMNAIPFLRRADRAPDSFPIDGQTYN